LYCDIVDVQQQTKKQQKSDSTAKRVTIRKESQH